MWNNRTLYEILHKAFEYIHVKYISLKIFNFEEIFLKNIFFKTKDYIKILIFLHLDLLKQCNYYFYYSKI